MEIILSIATLLLGGSTGVLFYNTTKRHKKAQAEQEELNTQRKVLENWIELYNKIEVSLNERDRRITDLTKQLDELRNRYINLQEEFSDFKMKVSILKKVRCSDRDCPSKMIWADEEIIIGEKPKKSNEEM